MDPGFLAYLYGEQDWWALVAASRAELYAGRDDGIAPLTLAAAYAHVAPERAEPLLLELARSPLRGWALLQLAEMERDRDPWLASAWLDRHRAEFPDAAAWRDGAQARLKLTVGDYDGARALLPAPLAERLPARPGRRSPVATGLASAVAPGLGQAWSGSWLEAGSALVVVGALGGATAWAVKERETPTAVVVGAVAGLFWAGNIYGGADAAVRFNRRRMRGYEEALDAAGLDGDGPPPLP